MHHILKNLFAALGIKHAAEDGHFAGDLMTKEDYEFINFVS